ncbi:hypothetical protein [Ideonella livida]|uniref:Uncharacterized protein n=1 Tax=Ideonella livida TaxID=2707176 RepID=A0A7C9PEW4_9BURK|nr:hypothetical protein [Ideonella livida]NDY89730.1 hypothetical protein [Ideonella livida]
MSVAVTYRAFVSRQALIDAINGVLAPAAKGLRVFYAIPVDPSYPLAAYGAFITTVGGLGGNVDGSVHVPYAAGSVSVNGDQVAEYNGGQTYAVGDAVMGPVVTCAPGASPGEADGAGEWFRLEGLSLQSGVNIKFNTLTGLHQDDWIELKELAFTRLFD